MKSFRSNRFLILCSLLVLAVALLCWRVDQMSRQARLDRRLLDAIRNADIAATRACLQKGADPNARTRLRPDPSFWQSLWEMFPHPGASPREDLSTPALLLVIPYKLKAQVPNGLSEERRSAAVTLYRLLLEKGADPNATDFTGDSALHTACEHGMYSVVKLLLDRGANINFKDRSGALLLTAALGSSDTVRLLLEHGVDSNVRYSYTSYMSSIEVQNVTPLIHAARMNDCDSMKVLLAKGADINAQDAEGDTALIWAASYNHPEGVRFLLAAGADVSVRNYRGETALKAAKREGLTDIVRLFQRAGANK